MQAQTHLQRPRAMLTFILSLLSLRNLLLVFLLFNAKVLPLAWELRLLYRGWAEWRSKSSVAKILYLRSNSNTSNTSSNSSSDKPPAHLHPLFMPHVMTTTAPLLEIDHNLHKSNSCYFADLDESRTALMVRLLSPTNFSPAELDREGYTGRFSIVLGSVHASFLREIKPYSVYRVRSRVLGWDQKWILIGSFFVRATTAVDHERARREQGRRKMREKSQKEEEEDKENGETLLAVCLSKYVVKKGRFTVPPERCWRSAGWLPDKPSGAPSTAAQSDSNTPRLEETETDHANGQKSEMTEETLRRRAQETLARAADRLEQKAENRSGAVVDDDCLRAANAWSWEDLEAERVRGLKIAESWLRLDGELRGLWQQDWDRGLAVI